MKQEVMQSPALTASKLKKMHPDPLNRVSTRTIQHRLQKDMGLPTRRITKKPMLTEAMKKRRVAFCKKYKEWTPEQWREVMFNGGMSCSVMKALLGLSEQS